MCHLLLSSSTCRVFQLSIILKILKLFIFLLRETSRLCILSRTQHMAALIQHMAGLAQQWHPAPPIRNSENVLCKLFCIMLRQKIFLCWNDEHLQINEYEHWTSQKYSWIPTQADRQIQKAKATINGISTPRKTASCHYRKCWFAVQPSVSSHCRQWWHCIGGCRKTKDQGDYIKNEKVARFSTNKRYCSRATMML